VCTVNLFHGESNFCCRFWSTHNKLTYLVIYPISTLMTAVCIIELSFIQAALRRCFLTIWSWQLKYDWLLIPTMGLVIVAYTPTESFGKSSKVKPKGESIIISRKWEVNLPIHFKPPYLLQICYNVEPEMNDTRNVIQYPEQNEDRLNNAA